MMVELPQRPVKKATPQDKMLETPEGREALWQAEMIRRKGPEVRSLDQSWRDKIAASLIGAGMPVQTVEGLLGSRGLGMSGPLMGAGLVDLTPFGIPFWLNEAHRAQKAGNATEQFLNTISAMPIVGPAAKGALKVGAGLLDEGVDVAKRAAGLLDEGADAAKQGIRAYHGSPHADNVSNMSTPPKNRYGFNDNADAYEELFHGTTENKLKSISKKGLTVGNRSNFDRGSPDMVYLSNATEGAEYWAKKLYLQGRPVVLEIRVPKDQIGKISKDTGTMGSTRYGEYAFDGPIPREWITGYWRKDAEGYDEFVKMNPPKRRKPLAK